MSYLGAAASFIDTRTKDGPEVVPDRHGGISLCLRSHLVLTEDTLGSALIVPDLSNLPAQPDL
jgi:hypothetical protein